MSAPNAPATSSEPRPLYVPVHKRAASESASAAFEASRETFRMRMASPAASSSRSEAPEPALPVYSITMLLGLASSPLARLPADTRTELRSRVPDIVRRRRARKSAEWHGTRKVDGVESGSCDGVKEAEARRVVRGGGGRRRAREDTPAKRWTAVVADNWRAGLEERQRTQTILVQA
ncbi:hypothetical protein PLICRDRAFT_42202 [Plicaturopsis crispa FD-325 SS-3]|nr:hypothetical protein PLICRDRAFT_42202 [Plicaturopsis crispa FD-325 SS-3]